MYTTSVFWEADATTLAYTYVSPEVEKLLGFPPSHWLAENDFWLRRIHPDDQEATFADLTQFVTQGGQFILSYRWQLANEQWVWIEDRVQAVPASHPQRLLGTKKLQSFVDSSLAQQAVDVANAIDHINQRLFVQGTFQERLADSLNTLGNQLGLEAIFILENRFDNETLWATCRYHWGQLGNSLDNLTYEELGLKTAVSKLSTGITSSLTAEVHSTGYSTIAAPIFHEDIWQGSLICYASAMHRAWLPIEIEAITIFAEILSSAFHNVRSYEQTQQQLFETTEQLEEAETLNEIAAHLNSALELDEVLQQTIDALRRYLSDVQSCGLSILESSNQNLRMHAQWLQNPEYELIPLGQSFPISETTFTRQALSDKKPIVIHDLREIAIKEEQAQAVVDRGMTSLLYVPIIFHGKPIGMLHIYAWNQPRHFTQQEISLCEAVANQTAVAIERANLYERLQGNVDHLAEEVAARTAEVRAEHDRTVAILESVGEGILVTDIEANILYANPAMEYQTGYTKEELIGKNPKILASQQTPKDVYLDMWDKLLQGKLWSGELINRRKNGSLYDVSLTITPTFNLEGHIDGYVSVEADISRLKEIDRLKSEFVSNVSHELRTPLTNIKTYLTLLERGRPEKFPRYLQILNHEAVRLERLIQDLLDLSRLETETLPQRIESANLKHQVFKLIDAFAVKVRDKQISLQIDIPDDFPLVRIAENHLGQLLTNLIGNAISYTFDNSQVLIAASVTDTVIEKRMAHLVIQDNGPGIPQEEQGKIFDRFYRGKQVQTNREIPGTGLGLAICKEIATRYGGRIELKSELGEGTTFLVKLPIAN